MQQALTGGGGIAGFGKALGVLVGSEIGKAIGRSIAESLAKKAAAKIGVEAGAAIGGSIGGAIAPIIGQAIGAAIGMAVVYAIEKLGHHTEKDVFKTVGRLWGVQISDGLKQEIADKAKKVGDEVAAEYMSLGKIIDEAGGVAKKSMGKWVSALTDAFAVATWNAHYTKDDLQKTFNEVFPKLTAIVTKEGGIWSEQFQNLIRQARAFGLELDDVNSLLIDQVTTIGACLAAQLAPALKATIDLGDMGTQTVEGLADAITKQQQTLKDAQDRSGTFAFKKDIADLNAKIADYQATLAGAGEQGVQFVKVQADLADAQEKLKQAVVGSKEYADLQAKIAGYQRTLASLAIGSPELLQTEADLNDALAQRATLLGEVGNEQSKLNCLLQGQAKSAADAQASLDRVGQAALASYNAGIAKGLDQLTLLDDLAPALDNLVALEQNLGVESKNAVVQELIALRTRLNANKELAAAATSWGQTYAAMVNLGVKDTEALLAMQRQGVADYDALIAKGFTESQALAQIKGGLQAIYDAHMKTGAPIDENTQKLLDQAKAYGLISDNSKSLGDIFTGVGKDIVGAVDRLAIVIGGKLAPATEGFWDSSGATLENVAGRRYHQGGPVQAETHRAGSLGLAHAAFSMMPRLHTGGEMPAWLLPGEDVWSQADVARWGGLANIERLRTSGPGEGAAIGSTTLNVTFYITTPDKRGFDALLEQEIEPRLVDIWRRGGGQRTRARASLGLSAG
jgi:hypothetical protein